MSGEFTQNMTYSSFDLSQQIYVAKLRYSKECTRKHPLGKVFGTNVSTMNVSFIRGASKKKKEDILTPQKKVFLCRFDSSPAYIAKLILNRKVSNMCISE